MKNIFILVILTLFNFNQTDNEKIILTTGISMVPFEPRFGIEINKDTLYYCEEIIVDEKHQGDYNYFKAKIDPKTFMFFKFRVESHFKYPINYQPIVDDATLYQLDFSLNNHQNSTKFCFDFLNDYQSNVIRDIIKLKELKMEKIDYHEFPEDLLKETLPEPPPPPKH